MGPLCICCSMLGHLSTQFGNCGPRISSEEFCLASAKKLSCFQPQIWIPRKTQEPVKKNEIVNSRVSAHLHLSSSSGYKFQPQLCVL